VGDLVRLSDACDDPDQGGHAVIQSSGTALLVLALVACGEVVPPPAADAPPTGCQTGLTECDGICVDTQVDERYCGDCDTACLTGQSCAGGVCMAPCQSMPGFVFCDDACIDPQRDNTHCGAAGNCMGANAGVACMPPQSCSNGACSIQPKRAFVTSTLYTGAVGGVAGADVICQNHADMVGLGGTYLAWLADATTSPRVRFSQAPIQYIRTDGVPIANDWTDLVDGALLAPLNLTELGTPAPVPVPAACGAGVGMVWANANAFGDLIPNICGDMTIGAPMPGIGGQWGRPEDPAAWATWCSGGSCDFQAPLYCFEQ
jgi:hypothetical protein